MTRYRSTPQEVEAMQWRGDNWEALKAFDAPVKLMDGEVYLIAGKDGAQEQVPVPVWHWIVRAVDDFTDYWPVDPVYFASKYECLVTS